MKRSFLPLSGISFLTASLSLALVACGESPDVSGEASANPAVAVADAAQNGGETAWTENYQEARSAAVEAGRPLLVLFTGSDWCPPCKQLERRVLSSEEFAAFARQNVVLMKADYPRGQQAPDVAEQNRELAEQYRIQGFPTLMLLDPQSGEVLQSKAGYSGEAPQAVLGQFRSALPQS